MVLVALFFLFKQKTAYEMRISDWSSDVCSSDLLTQAIISGELRPGTRISEPKLAKQLGVSRGPLREATRRLQERMLVTHTPRQGVRVVELSREVLHEVCTIREALEGIAAREAAINITDEEAIELTGAIERHRRLLESTRKSVGWGKRGK